MGALQSPAGSRPRSSVGISPSHPTRLSGACKPWRDTGNADPHYVREARGTLASRAFSAPRVHRAHRGYAKGTITEYSKATLGVPSRGGIADTRSGGWKLHAGMRSHALALGQPRVHSGNHRQTLHCTQDAHAHAQAIARSLTRTDGHAHFPARAHTQNISTHARTHVRARAHTHTHTRTHAHTHAHTHPRARAHTR